ncbi:type II toxin-antitoxin system RelE/ParE family toxin [Vibrio navarrensis]|uniref:Type II toxin-antitoxin system RelE/ParE family toxin n=1 Tax=Vibrio navarrensis TaxID=29495 RepID=A0AAJ4IH15_9VIBR|nr:type II toxin-antitoxin system RelE/ParE family toxin [Vibrio navarrensis]
MSHAIEFVETPLFSSQREELITDEEFRDLQTDIIKNPEVGKLIKGTGGLRKVRLATENGGKSGGYRIIYLYVLPDTVYLILAYKKGRKDSLTDSEKNQLKSFSSELIKKHRSREQETREMLKKKRDKNEYF